MKMPFKILFLTIITFTAVNSCNSQPAKNGEIKQLWLDCKLEKVVSFDVFRYTIAGLNKIQKVKNRDIITIIDFSKPSSEKRFFVIDLKNKQLLYNCLVAHGKNSGEITAVNFSNQEGSLKSSLGFYLTAETCIGKHGFTLLLDGLEKGINDNAREREIVIHGADYVSDAFIKKYGRLGKSWGCPALPVEISKQIIEKIANGSCLFIYAADDFYKKNSGFN